jgi:AraC family transcriptional regulator
MFQGRFAAINNWRNWGGKVLSRSNHVAITLPHVAVGLNSWDWPRDVSFDRMTNGCDCLFFSLSPVGAHSRFMVGAEQGAKTSVQLGALSFWPHATYGFQRPAGAETRGVRCKFNRSWFRERLGVPEHLNHISIQNFLDLRSHDLLEAMSKLAKELLDPGPASKTLVEGLSLTAAVELGRHLRQLNGEASRPRRLLSQSQIECVTQYLESFSGYIPDIDELAEMCGLSNSYFRVLFKETTNQTPLDYARSVWAEKAKALLRDPDLSIKQIWAQFDFTGPSTFAVAFRRATGETATSYRRRHQSPKNPGLRRRVNQEDRSVRSGPRG